jgi:hypothetical protein
MKILCQTFFDCTRTGVTGHFKLTAIPFQDHAGQWVRNITDWNHSRNQQRNYETLLQIFGLRTQIFELTNPVCNQGVWEFSFETESEAVYGQSDSDDALAGLKQECIGVPMMVGLDEKPKVLPSLQTQGEQTNIWFQVLNIKSETNHVGHHRN